MNRKVKVVLSTISPNITTRLMYLHNFKKPLSLRKPRNINEKLQYLKLKTYYNNNTITECVDKLLVRNYLSEKGLGSLCAPLIGGGYADAEELRKEWPNFPKQFVIKCNHGCGYNIIVTDKQKTDLDVVIKQLDSWMREDFWKVYCEPQYRFIKKQILVEKYLADDIRTYKFYCFNGEPKIVYVSANGESGEKDLYLDYFDMNWNWLPITLDTHLHAKVKENRPKNFEKMVELAKELAEGFPFVRIDLYNVDGNIYFSEFTFIPTGGMMKLKPENIIDEWGNLLQI